MNRPPMTKTQAKRKLGRLTKKIFEGVVDGSIDEEGFLRGMDYCRWISSEIRRRYESGNTNAKARKKKKGDKGDGGKGRSKTK